MILEKSALFLVWSDNEEIRLGDETDDITKGFINSFLNNYQREKIILRNGRDFAFEIVHLFPYHVHETSLRRESSQIKSPEWMLNKKATINQKNMRGNNKYFQYSIIVALHHQKFKAIQKEYQIFTMIF